MDDLLSTDACTLPTNERPLRLTEFDSLFADHLQRMDRSPDQVRLHLSGGPGFADAVRDLAERESACCSFFTFAQAGGDDDLTLTISVPEERREILSGLADRASTLMPRS